MTKVMQTGLKFLSTLNVARPAMGQNRYQFFTLNSRHMRTSSKATADSVSSLTQRGHNIKLINQYIGSIYIHPDTLSVYSRVQAAIMQAAGMGRRDIITAYIELEPEKFRDDIIGLNLETIARVNDQKELADHLKDIIKNQPPNKSTSCTHPKF